MPLCGRHAFLASYPSTSLETLKQSGSMAGIERMGDIYVAYDERSDYDALVNDIDAYLPLTTSIDILKHTNRTECPNSHPHTCSLSVEGNKDFAVISLFCIAEDDATNGNPSHCEMHRKRLAKLKPDSRHNLVHVLFDERFHQLETKILRSLEDTARVLEDAARGVSKGFASEGRSFQETAFNRLRALHVMMVEADAKAHRINRRMRDVFFDIFEVITVHQRQVMIEEVNGFLEGLASITSEASLFIAISSPEDELSKDLSVGQRCHRTLAFCTLRWEEKSLDISIAPLLPAWLFIPAWQPAVGDHTMFDVDSYGEGFEMCFILYEHRPDFLALLHRIKIYLSSAKAAQVLKQFDAVLCSGGHLHSCALSIEGNERFGVITIFCRGEGPLCGVANDSRPRCSRHLEPIAELSAHMKQEVAHVLYERRCKDLETKLEAGMEEVAEILAGASRGVSKRFSYENRRFRDNAFDRLRALHVLKDEIDAKGVRLTQKINDVFFKASDIATLHTRREMDEELDKLLEELIPLIAEATTYLDPKSTDERNDVEMKIE
ncbi:hypothetical protein SCHPADRAFT_940831 [Schizopora paradoxa]|uniref:Uncharacterized protein n=1 Tax=Schizopora paradoxa TaxID=27342 RepID=A0A0H2RM62_9AGAM|nr:hypothetical protein SCHPADRAFT_940831 [Schizopora paradoxa]